MSNALPTELDHSLAGRSAFRQVSRARPWLSISRMVIFQAVIIIFTTCLGLYKTGNPSRYFGEGRFTMGISCAQLLAVAWFAWCIYRCRRAATGGLGLFSPHLVWLLVASGFVFLTLDEGFELHEKLDRLIHAWVIHAKANPWTDRIDDALIAIYGLVGMGVMWKFRKEVLLLRRSLLLPLILGFVSLFVSVGCDALSNGDELLHWMTGDLALAKVLNGWLSVGDGAFTLLAEGLFINAFYNGWKQSRFI